MITVQNGDKYVLVFTVLLTVRTHTNSSQHVADSYVRPVATRVHITAK